MLYLSGEIVQIGDKILIEHGRTEGIVFAIVETSEQLTKWDLDTPCLMIQAEPFGFVSWAVDNDVRFVERKST